MAKLLDVVQKIQNQIDEDLKVLNECRSASDMAISSIRINVLRGVLSELSSVDELDGKYADLIGDL